MRNEKKVLKLHSFLYAFIIQRTNNIVWATKVNENDQTTRGKNIQSEKADLTFNIEITVYLWVFSTVIWTFNGLNWFFVSSRSIDGKIEIFMYARNSSCRTYREKVSLKKFERQKCRKTNCQSSEINFEPCQKRVRALVLFYVINIVEL